MRTAVIGHVEWVELVRVAMVPGSGEIVHGEPWWEGPAGGGPAAAVQMMKLAGGASFYTALGDDELGHRAKEELENLGLEVHVAFRDEPTRRAWVLIDDERERTITVVGSRLDPRAQDPLPWALLDGMDAVYLTAADVAAARAARRAKLVVATARMLDPLREAGIRLDALVGSASDPGESIEDGDLFPAPDAVFLTEGSRGGRFWMGQGWERFAAARHGPVIDRYGCGDAFAAGLTYGLGLGLGLKGAAQVASMCGAAVLEGRGPYEGQLDRVHLAAVKPNLL